MTAARAGARSRSTWRTARRGALLVGLVALACGGDSKPKQDAAAPPPEKPVERPAVDTSPLPLGVARPADFAYEWGKGAAAYRTAAAARGRRDWAAVRRACEEALAADPGHLDAHRLLASALAQQGAHAKAIEHLRIALAGDFASLGHAAGDPDLAPLTSSPLGGALAEMVAAYREQFARSARGGLLLVARRGPFKAPAKRAGATSRLASRAEVFAYVRETRRYLRLTRTGFHVLGFLASPSGDELAWVSATQVALADPAPILAGVKVGAVRLASPDSAMTAHFENARALALEYAGDELVATTYDADGRWGLRQARPYVIDRSQGKVTARPKAEPTGRRLLVRHETVELETAGDTDGIAADWNPETGAAEEFVIESSQKRVRLPPGQAAARSSMAWSRDRSRFAFATAADPCASQRADRRATLFLVDAESGRLTQVHTAASRFWPRFLDSATLAFEDDRSGVRLHDAALAREVAHLETRGGLALHGLGAEPGPICTGPAPSASKVELAE
jgi:hypothetical protein